MVTLKVLILSTILLSNTDNGSKRFFAKKAQFLNFVTKNGGCLTFLVAARQP